MEPESAAAVAAACPLLRSASLRPRFDSFSKVLAALAPLEHLEELLASSFKPASVSEGLVALADGPAGRSLRRIALLDGKWLYEYGEFPKRSVASLRSIEAFTTCINSAAIVALGRMPRLECFEPLRMNPLVNPEDIPAIGRIANLQEAHVHFDCLSTGRAIGPHLRAVAEALACLPRLARLKLNLNDYSPSVDSVVAALSSAGVRRALTYLRLAPGRPAPLSEAEAEAIVALPALERIELVCTLDRDSSSRLRPFEVLRNLSTEIEVDVRACHNGSLKEAEAEIQRMFSGHGQRSRRERQPQPPWFFDSDPRLSSLWSSLEKNVQPPS
eukprot:tig00020553_g10589.t1